MNFNIYLDDKTGQQLNEAAIKAGESRNALVRKAVSEWLQRLGVDWVWFHPYFRARGHFQKAWPTFEQKYGRFHLAQPVSCGMKEFLQRVGWQQARVSADDH